jgi:Lipid A 3-O-deacylase (PagL)
MGLLFRNQSKEQGMHAAAKSRTERRRIGIHLLCWLILPFFNFSSAKAGSPTVENKAVVSGPTENPDFITGGQGDFLLTEGFYNSSFIPSPRKPIFAFAETDLQFGYMLPIIGKSFYRGDFEGLVDLFAWASTREQSGVLGGGALGLDYNFIQPGWRFVPYLGLSLGLSGNNLYEDQNQRIIGGPFAFVLQAKTGARFFIRKNWGLILEGGFEHVSNLDIYQRNVGLNQIGGRLGLFCLF